MLTKFVYSCLVDADRLDAYLFENGLEYKPSNPDWDSFLARLVKKLGTFDATSEIGAFRRQVSDSCAQAGAREQGIYKLEVPTGGGKTLASLRFALEHAKRHGLERVIYVIPYLSILSQTAQDIRHTLDADEFTVLEHHSGFLPDEPTYYKLQTDRWDAPVVLTTQVQFLESLFSARGSDLRKLHNMANSVIIFDEAQSLPVKCVHLFNGAINFLYSVCGSTILLCTATQPLLDKVNRPIRLSENPSLVQCGPLAKRTRVVSKIKADGYSYLELADFVRERHESSTLVIVNTKAAAKALYEELKDDEVAVLHLSTNMCAAHRDAVIAELRQRLKEREPILCISTQLIEAGVDISFACVIREVAGLDSIYQAAGRCNRHGEFEQVKDVYVVNISGQKLDKLPDIKIGAEITRWLFDEGRGDNIEEYYRRYFYARRGSTDYSIEGGTLYDLLSHNKQGQHSYRGRKDKKGVPPPRMLAAIRSAADGFYVIDRGRMEVIVPYGRALELVSQYAAAAGDDAKRRRLLQTLGKYSVSLYQYQLDALEQSGALYAQDGLTILAGGFYDPERGVDLDGRHEFLYV